MMLSVNSRSPQFAEGARLIDRFVCILADTEEARRLHHQVRFKVFCEETGFEDPDAFPTKAEHDAYDTYAKHFIIWDRRKQRCAGAMRLVSAAKTKLPCQDFAAAPLDQLDQCREHAVEFSRLCILSDYRRTNPAHHHDDYRPQGNPADVSVPVVFRQQENEVFLRLLRASFAWSEVRYCYFIVTAALSRVLARFGIPLTQVGEKLEHRGIRIPYRYEVKAAEAGMRRTLPGFDMIARTSQHYVTAGDFFSGKSDRQVLNPLSWHRDLSTNPCWLPTMPHASAIRHTGYQPGLI